MNDYLSKPIRIQEVLAKITQWTGRRNRADEAQAHDSDSGPLEPSRPPVDMAMALEQTMGDRDLLESLLEEFETMLRNQIPALLEMVNAGRAEELEKDAHRLKGAAANLYIETVRQLAEQLEKIGKKGELDHAGPLLDALKVELDRLQLFRQELLDGRVIVDSRSSS
jgi:HPt (histidine-containing phosphotransfer) domain-containing protein